MPSPLPGMDPNPYSAIYTLCGLGPRTYLSMPQFPPSQMEFRIRTSQVACGSVGSFLPVVYLAQCLGRRRLPEGKVGAVLSPAIAQLFRKLLTFLPHSAQTQLKSLELSLPFRRVLRAGYLPPSPCPPASQAKQLAPHPLLLKTLI